MSLRHLTPAAATATLLIAVGCATHADGGTGDVGGVAAAVELAPPFRGVQLETLGVTVEAGDDMRWCEVVVIPGIVGDALAINRIETAMSEHGQDLTVAVAHPGSPTEAIMDEGARVPCLRAGEAFGEELATVVTTQHGYHDQRYPDGVGQALRGGQKLVVEYHYVNETAEPIAAKARINLHLSAADMPTRIAHTATFDNLTIYTPPLGHSSHVAECSMSQPAVVGELVRRTRRWGTDFRVWIQGGERDGELLWHSRDYRDTNLELREPIALGPEEGFRFQCDYYNGSQDELRFGTTAADETCSLQAIWWNPNPGTETEPQQCLLLHVDPDGVAR